MPPLSSLIAHLSSLKKTLFYSYLFAITALVALPLNNANELNDITILRLRGDYFLHILLFMPWSFFRQASKIKTLPWLLLGLFFAAGSEGLQYFLPWRAFNVNDLLANALGVVLGWGLFILYKVKHRNKQTQK